METQNSISKHPFYAIPLRDDYDTKFDRKNIALSGIHLANSPPGNNYYVSNNGSDTNNGLTPETAFKTIEAMEAVAIPADNRFLQKGSTFSLSKFLLIAKSGQAGSPTVYDAYGTGANPIISGLKPLDNWTNDGGNIWKTSLDSGKELKQLIICGVVTECARFPKSNAANGGWLSYSKYQGVQGNASFNGGNIPAGNWLGATIVIKKNLYVIDRGNVLSISGSTITFNSPTGILGLDNYGYFFKNHINALTANGDWAYDNVNKVIRIYSTHNPNSLDIQVPGMDYIIAGLGKSNISFQNIDFMGANLDLIKFDSACKNMRFENCNFNFAGRNAFWAELMDTLYIAHCTFKNISSTEIFAGAVPNSYYGYNVIEGLSIIGAGEDGVVSYMGVYSTGNNITHEYNQIRNKGCCGISAQCGNNVIVRFNYVDTFCTIKEDFGGIDTNGPFNGSVFTNCEFYSNVVLNGIGTPYGKSVPSFQPVYGLYCDDSTTSLYLHDNVSAHHAAGCYYLHNAINNRVVNNLGFDAPVILFLNFDNRNHLTLRGNTFSENIFIAKYPTQIVLSLRSLDNDVGSFGQFSNNKYARTFGDEFYIALQPNFTTANVQNIALPQWQAAPYNQDIGSTSVFTDKPYTIQSKSSINLIGNSKLDNARNTTFISAPRTDPNQFGINTAGVLDGNSFAVTFPNPPAGNRFDIVTPLAAPYSLAKQYLLTFSLLTKAMDKGTARVSGNGAVTTTQNFLTTAGRKEFEIFLVGLQDSNTSSLYINLPETVTPAYLDNLYILQAVVIPRSPEEFLFVYNATSKPISVYLNQQYKDVYGAIQSGKITFQPFTGAVYLPWACDDPPPLPEIKANE
jgi:hypothetical protein